VDLIAHRQAISRGLQQLDIIVAVQVNGCMMVTITKGVVRAYPSAEVRTMGGAFLV